EPELQGGGLLHAPPILSKAQIHINGCPKKCRSLSRKSATFCKVLVSQQCQNCEGRSKPTDHHPSECASAPPPSSRIAQRMNGTSGSKYFSTSAMFSLN